MSGALPPGAQGRNIVAFAILALVWGSTWLVIKDQISLVPPAWSVTWRFTLAGAVMLGMCAARGERLVLPLPALKLAALVGLFQFALNFQLVYASELYLTSGLVAVLFALMMIPNALLAKLFLGQPITRRFVLGGAVALCGVGLMLAHEYRAATLGPGVLWGVALAGASVLSASVGNVLQANRAAKALPVLPLMAWAMLFGALGNAAYAWFATGAPRLDPRPQYLWGIAYLALAGSVLTFPLYSRLLRDWGPGKAAYNGVAVPVVAMLLSTLFERFTWTILAGGGAALALCGLLIALSPRSKPNGAA